MSAGLYGSNIIRPTARDGRWVVTANRWFCWGGRAGWCEAAPVGKQSLSLQNMCRAPKNAALFDEDEAKTFCVSRTLFGPEATRWEGKSDQPFRRGGALDLFEPAQIEYGMLVWTPKWVVYQPGNGYLGKSGHYLSFPGYGVYFFAQIKMFDTIEAAKDALPAGGQTGFINKYGQVSKPV